MSFHLLQSSASWKKFCSWKTFLILVDSCRYHPCKSFSLKLLSSHSLYYQDWKAFHLKDIFWHTKIFSLKEKSFYDDDENERSWQKIAAQIISPFRQTLNKTCFFLHAVVEWCQHQKGWQLYDIFNKSIFQEIFLHKSRKK